MAEERRLVTILFSDVAGSTALGEELDPEDLRALLGRYYAIAKDVVAEHGGTLEKFIGDAVMAVFGLPQAHGDDAVRAVAAAEQLRDRVRADPRLGDQLPIRIGLNTGEVVATRDASSGDFLITGDAVNTAARLQQLAEPWAIVCGERTASAAAGHYAFGPAAVLTAKGKRAPLRALPLKGRAATRSRVRMPLFGRSGDLAQLELHRRRRRARSGTRVAHAAASDDAEHDKITLAQ
jgi:class 3 adenylate cyclase